jgi:hypothetical protein
VNHKDRNRVQVPRNLPDWMDGPTIHAKMKLWDCSYTQAKRILKHRQNLFGQKKR